MEYETLAAALKLAPKRTLPAVTAEDAGALLVVDNEGKWSKGEVITATISVNETKLEITAAE